MRGISRAAELRRASPLNALWGTSTTVLKQLSNLAASSSSSGIRSYIFSFPVKYVCLCDFAGSGLDGVPPEVWAQSGFRHPDEELQGTIRGEIHALGSTIYELLTSSSPHWEEEKAQIDKGWGEGKADELMREGNYPDLTGVTLGDIIAQCWSGAFQNAESVVDAIVPKVC